MTLHQALQHATLLLLALTTATTSALTTNPRGNNNNNNNNHHQDTTSRSRTSLNTDWHFHRFLTNPDNITYDLRPDHANSTTIQPLKPWILPYANPFLPDPATHHSAPTNTSPPAVPAYALPSYNPPRSEDWSAVTLPHDWAIAGPFYVGDNVPIGGGMGRLPSQGVGWYRRTLDISAPKKGERLFLEFDGAMSYALVWVNGVLVGGWPYGYNSFRVEVTDHVKGNGRDVVAVRVDNPVSSSRWYPGGGLYRSVWLTRVGSVAVRQWGTQVVTRSVGEKGAVVGVMVGVENVSGGKVEVGVETGLYVLNGETGAVGKKVADVERGTVVLAAGASGEVNGSAVVQNPRLWGPWTSQTPNLYVAVSKVYVDGEVVDTYSTEFGIRSLVYDGDKGLFVNDERVRIQGVNQHHDLGALGAAFNYRAAQRQLETLRDLGANAIRMSHNPPDPQLLQLTDRMGFLVIDEIFDCWELQKNPNDFHLIFPDWSEADLRSFIRRDRNHPSVIAWSVGNEVGEQYTDTAGAAIGHRLRTIALSEDPTRPITASMNYAKPTMPFPAQLDLISLNYQGEGIRDAPAYANLTGTTTPPLYPAFHAAFPQKLIFSSETAAALSSRGTYLFPVTNETSAPVLDPPAIAGGGDPLKAYVSAYELYTAPFGSSADKVFSSQDAAYPYVAGEFVWSGWDYLGEPTPYYSARSAYFGIIDLAGFRKDRFYLYQARWREEVKMVHVLPHWSFGAEREGQTTPVHAFTNGDEAELWVNGVSQGRKTKVAGTTNFRFRWDDVVYKPGTIKVVAYKGGKEWAREEVKTVGAAAGLRLTADRGTFKGDGQDLSFVTVEVVDKDGNVVPTAVDKVAFEVEGPGEIAVTDNGDPTDMTSFVSKERKVFNGLGLVIVRGNPGATGKLTLKATGAGLKAAQITLRVQ